MAPRLGFVWLPTDDRKLAIRGSAGSSTTRTTSTTTTCMSTRRCWRIAASTSTATARRTTRSITPRRGSPASRIRCRAFLAERFPLFPNVASLGLIPELVVTLAPDFRVPYTRAGHGRLHAPAARATSRCRPTTFTRTARTCSCSATSISTSSTAQWVNIDPRFTGINLAENIGYIKYHALQTRGEYRGTRLRTGLSYTLSKATSNSSTSAVGGGAGDQPARLVGRRWPDQRGSAPHRRDGRRLRAPARRSSSPASIATTARCPIA